MDQRGRERGRIAGAPGFGALAGAALVLLAAACVSRETAPPRRDAPAPRPGAEAAMCRSALAATGARFLPRADLAAGSCSSFNAVAPQSFAGDTAMIAIAGVDRIGCPLAQTVAAWARYGADRAARQILDSGVARIETFGAYSCRNVAGSPRLSAHANANALDVSGFVLADGRRITLKDDWHGGTEAERRFLRVVHASACKRFGTVLGPGYNAAHADHFHVEAGNGSFCR